MTLTKARAESVDVPRLAERRVNASIRRRSDSS